MKCDEAVEGKHGLSAGDAHGMLRRADGHFALRGFSENARTWCMLALVLVLFAGTGAFGGDDWARLNADARERAKTPIRVGVPGTRPFWNGHAKAFIHPPAFDFKEVEGATAYRFALSRDGVEPIVWTAAKPWMPLPADIWDSIKPGYCTLRVTGIGQGVESVSGERTFYRAAVFHGPYPKAVCGYREAAKKVYAAVYRMPQVQGWKTHDDPPPGYDLYCYPAKILSSMIRALVRHAKTSRKTSSVEADDALFIACKMADWLIAHSQPDGAPLAHFPPTYWGDRRSVAVKNAGQNMLVYPASAANAYIELSLVTRSDKYLNAAMSIARTYARLQGADGTWPLKVRESDGSPVRANRLVPGRGLFAMFDQLAPYDATLAAVRDRAFAYVLDGPFKTWNWDAQFEDMEPMPPYTNLQKGIAVDAAVRLFAQGRIADAREILDWSEDQFVVWSDPIHNMDWRNWKTPTALEQYDYYTPIDGSMAEMVAAFAAAYKATGDRLYLEKAKALADNITRHQRPDGTIPTYFDSRKGSDWVNCMIYVADILEGLEDVLPEGDSAFHQMAEELPPESEFAFRSRLEEVHEPGLRDMAQKATADEFVLADGAEVAFSGENTPYMRRALADFADFMKVSMGVAVSVNASSSSVKHGVRIVTGGIERGYEVDVGADGVAIRAKDDRQAAQALYHLEDLMGFRRAPFLKFGSERRAPLFSPRMAHSGWGCDQYPDSYLMKLQHTGIDTIILFMEKAGIASCNTHSGEGLRLDAAAFIRRMKDFGFDTYVYSQATGFKHPSDPDAPQFFDDLYGGISKDCRGAKGYILVDEKCHFPSKDPRVCKWDPNTRKKVDPSDPRPYPSYFPGCDYLDWVDIVKRSILRYSPEAEIVFWTYAFVWAPPEPCREFIRKLPKDMPVMATFESGLKHVKRNGMHSQVEDYSIAAVGPGDFFRRQAGEACANGHKVYTMANCAGLAWDFGTIPYNPCPYQWRRRWDAVKAAQRDWNVRGVMECHHYGVWPSFITELEKEAFTEGGMDFDEHVRKIAVRDFGEKGAERALASWRSWSEAIADMSPRGENQYGPFRMGPAYPFNAFQPELEAKDWLDGKKPMHVSSYARGCGSDYDSDYIRKELELFTSMAARYFDGAAAFREIASETANPRRREKALRMAYLGEYMARAVTTAKHVREGTLAERAGDREKAKALAALEYANTKAAIEIMKRDSRLGWEPTMGYQGGVAACEWKLRRLERLYGSAQNFSAQSRFATGKAPSDRRGE